MAYLTLFRRKFPKNSRKKSQRSGRGGWVKPVGTKSQLLPKIRFACFPIDIFKKNAQLAHVGFPKVTRPQEYIQCVTLSMEMLTSRPVIKIALETKLCVMSQ